MLLSGKSGDEERLTLELIAFGVPEEQARAAFDEDEAILEVPIDLKPAVILFSSCNTQWVVAGMGSVIGISYSALNLISQWLGIPITEDVYECITVMEDEALKIFREQADART